jgi:hypothetical protein
MESTIKHAGGTWTATTHGTPWDTCRVFCEGHEIAKVSGKEPFENEANARLMAAAPDMLAVLTRFCAGLDGDNWDGQTTMEIAIAARASIAKATGTEAANANR